MAFRRSPVTASRPPAVRTCSDGPGISRHAGGALLGRHRHRSGYAALALAGGYVEAGDRGRHRIEAGDVVLHAAYEAHRDEFSPAGALVLNLPLAAAPAHPTGRVEDVDAILRLAERDPRGASELLLESLKPCDLRLNDWPDLLAEALTSDLDLRIADWAERMKLAPASVSRGFQRAYGISPKRYRARQRSLRALKALPGWRGSLALLAAELGFADQAHMTRCCTALTGRTPRQIRVKSVQDRRGTID
jgi:AraC-like DNA-binding protein